MTVVQFPGFRKNEPTTAGRSLVTAADRDAQRLLLDVYTKAQVDALAGGDAVTRDSLGIDVDDTVVFGGIGANVTEALSPAHVGLTAAANPPSMGFGNGLSVALNSTAVVCNMGYAFTGGAYQFFIQSQHKTNTTKFQVAINPDGGHVAVGHYEPLAQLHVKATQPRTMVIERAATTNATIQFKTSTGDVYFGQSSGGAFAVGPTSNLLDSPYLAVDTAGTVTANGITASVRFSLPVYTFDTVPAASAHTGAIIRISDRAQRQAYSDGTNWRFTADDIIIA